MTKPKTPQPLARVLANDAMFAAWNARHQREEILLSIVRRQLPRPVAERVFVADGSGPVLELSTGTGAVATVVRQRAPDLLQQLRREGCQFTGIRVRVQPRHAPGISRKSVPPQWDSNAKQHLSALAARLPEGPLREVLSRLLRRAG